MKNYTIAILISSFIFTACGTPAPNNTGNGNAANTVSNQATANTNSIVNSTADSIAPSSLSPTETMKALNEAAKKKDTASIKNLVSKGTLDILEENAKEQGMTIDELLKNDEETPFEELPEMRNENIAGDKATIEVKDKESNEWTTLPFIKENGAWKIALDEYVEEIEHRMLEEMKKMPANSAKEKDADKVDKKEVNANKAANK